MLYEVGNGGASSPTDLNQFFNLLTGVSTDQQVTVSQRIRAQLAGAVYGNGGYVGENQGPPGGGTFNTGDFVVDPQGCLWVCTAGGSPGTWKCASGSTLISSSTITTTTTFGSIPQNFKHLQIILSGFHTTDAVQYVLGSMTLNGDNSSAYNYMYQLWTSGNSPVNGNTTFTSAATSIAAAYVYTGASPFTGAGGYAEILISDYTNASTGKNGRIQSYASDGGSEGEANTCFWAYHPASAITSVTIGTGGHNITGGRVSIYGLA